MVGYPYDQPVTPNPYYKRYYHVLGRKGGGHEFTVTGPPPPPKRNRAGAVRTLGRVGRIGRPRRVRTPSYTDASCIKSEDIYDVTQGGQCWVQFKHYDRDRLFAALAEHLLIKILNRAGSPVVSQDAVPKVFGPRAGMPSSVNVRMPTLGRITYHFVRDGRGPSGPYEEATHTQNTGDSTTTESGQYFDLSFKSITDLIKGTLKEWAAKGFYLQRVTVYRLDVDAVHTSTHPGTTMAWWFEMDNIASRRMNVVVSNLYKIQNITPAPSTGMSGDDPARYTVDDIEANPLSGTVYDFNTPSIRFRRDWIDEKGDAGKNFMWLQQLTEHDEAVSYCGAMRLTAGGGVPTDSHTMVSPLNLQSPWRRELTQVKTVFSSITGMNSFVMKPGGFTSLTRTFRFNGTWRQLSLGLYGTVRGAGGAFEGADNVASLATTGTSHLLRLSHLMRDKTAIDNSVVKVVINHKSTYSVSSSGPKKRRVLCRYIEPSS